MIYLDNAATTFPKPKSVIEKTVECITKYCANSGRSAHSLALRTDEEIYRTREILADFLSFQHPEKVCCFPTYVSLLPVLWEYYTDILPKRQEKYGRPGRNARSAKFSISLV